MTKIETNSGRSNYLHLFLNTLPTKYLKMNRFRKENTDLILRWMDLKYLKVCHQIYLYYLL